MSELALGQIKLLFPKFPITDTVIQHIGEEYEFQDISNCVEDSNRPEDCAELRTYERYGGSYAQDEMGYSDDDIDTIFDGDPSAYWNID